MSGRLIIVSFLQDVEKHTLLHCLVGGCSMSKNKSQEGLHSRLGKIIYAIKTPMSFFALVLLLMVEIIIIMRPDISQGKERTFLIVSSVVVIIILVIIVALLTVFKPKELGGGADVPIPPGSPVT